MPRNEHTWRRMELLTIPERLALGDWYQDHWYQLVARHLAGSHSRVLDIGAGTGRGVDILRAAGCSSTGIDPLPCGPGIVTMEEAVRFGVLENPWDWLTCIDVIEHVEDDAALLEWMLSTARHGVFLSTPNWNVSRCANSFHVREYTPEELMAIVADCAPGCHVTWWTSGADCVARRVDSPTDAEHNFGVEIVKGPEVVQ